ncbi:PREDICTED: uncharacterized protein LOC104811175 [Tarenaya hassleriana]|uniref:uncharacterized protein LOC104811175 n=1 Tax=Tarenaya hassleriana TaxID=28532 RepID=UPI00053C68FE|nr:PREDICTED: uncharacterized protein LOC104811175 [Tarenaya hassleriana]
MPFENNNTNLNKLGQMSQHLPLSILCRWIAVSGSVLFFLHMFVFSVKHRGTLNLVVPSELKFSSFSSSSPPFSPPETVEIPTDISHVVFVIVGSVTTWKHRRGYIESWWRPNITRGHVFLEQPPKRDLLPWPQTSPPFRINKDPSAKPGNYTKLTSQTAIRLYQSLSDSFFNASDSVRWFVVADDDTLFFLDNLVEVLNKYDHKKHYYIGMNSENIWSNEVFSYDMGYGGGGYALSYLTVEALVGRMEECIRRYPLMFSDLLSFLCLSDMGVDLTLEKGFHQIDLHGDISGLLSAHPHSPPISLHHFDVINPIFPTMSRQESVNNLMKTAKTDQTRLLQQTICYRREINWSVSISWGYSVQIYETIIARSQLKRPLETFTPWRNVKPPFYRFNTRRVTKDPCEMPHLLFLDSTVEENNGEVSGTYRVKTARRLPPCVSNGNHSALVVTQVRVAAPTLHKKDGRIECCDVRFANNKTDVLDVKIRDCMKDEILA